jgi:mono/diheme cytochrome c family protein
MKKTIVISGSFALAIMLLSFNFKQDDVWKVPEKYEKMKNPVAADAESIAAGKILYEKRCLKCHGNSGKGDGIKASSLNHQPADFTSQEFQKQTDGALLYKIYYGHMDMPGFKNRIPDNTDVIEGEFGKTRTPGDLINFLRTLAK